MTGALKMYGEDNRLPIVLRDETGTDIALVHRRRDYSEMVNTALLFASAQMMFDALHAISQGAEKPENIAENAIVTMYSGNKLIVTPDEQQNQRMLQLIQQKEELALKNVDLETENQELRDAIEDMRREATRLFPQHFQEKAYHEK